MSSLLKSGLLEEQGGSVRPFPRSEPAPAAAGPSREELLLARVEELEAELEALSGQWPEKLEQECRKAALEALEERSNAEERALDALAGFLSEARRAWAERLSAWDSAAVGIARAVLEQVLARDAAAAIPVEGVVARQLERLESSAILRVRLAPGELPGEGGIAAAAPLGDARIEIVTDSSLPAGSCIVDLLLGHLECGIPAQWKRIEALLERLEQESGGQ